MSKYLSKRFESLQPYTYGEQPQDMAYVKLNTNESPFPPSRSVAEVMNGAVAESLRLYPDPCNRQLVGAVSKTFGIAENQIFCGNGSDEVLAFVFWAFFADGVAFPDVSYGFYPVYADVFGAKTEIIALNEDYRVDTARFASSEYPILLANPNAPTGIALELAEIEELLKSKPDRLVVVDEAYVDFGAQTAIPLLEKYDNLLIVQTLSKSRSLAGARIGFAFGSKELIEDLNKLRFSFNSYNVSRLAEKIGAAALSDTQYFETCRTAIMKNRDRTEQLLEELGFEVLPSKANFLFARKSGVDGGALYRGLKARGVLVRYFDKPRLRDFVRITIGTAEQTDALITAIKDFLS